MMMALGLFVFSLSTLPYQELKRRRGWRFASNNRVGKKPARQYVGDDDETISLSGVLLPELTGGDLSLAAIEAMATQHTSWPLIEGNGHISRSTTSKRHARCFSMTAPPAASNSQ